MSAENVETFRGVRIALSPLGERSSRRRTLDERLFVRLPVLFRPFSIGLMRLSPRFRPRQRLVARLIRRAYAAANRRDFGLILMSRDPDSEYRPAADLLAPDQDQVFAGHDGYLRMWRNWLDAFEDLRFDPEGVLDLGNRFLVTARQQGHGASSGLAVSQPIFQLFEGQRGPGRLATGLQQSVGSARSRRTA